MKAQLTSVEQQQLKAQEGLKEKDNQLEKLQSQLKTVQGSFEMETKKLKGQIAELEENGAKKASSNLIANLNILFFVNLMFVDVIIYVGSCRQKRKVSFGSRCQALAKNWLPRSVAQQTCKRL